MRTGGIGKGISRKLRGLGRHKLCVTGDEEKGSDERSEYSSQNTFTHDHYKYKKEYPQTPHRGEEIHKGEGNEY